jgi:AcrR family transcriptional regulator
LTRISKEPDERRAEIVKAAAELFSEKGYDKTAVSDIVHAINVAQGTYYYYFKSKEDVMLAVLDQLTDEIIQKLTVAIDQPDLNPAQKIVNLSELEFQLNREHDSLFQQLHLEQNSGLHQKIIVQSIQKTVPLYTKVIQEGVQQGIFNTEYPKEAAELMLIATKFLFDPGIFQWSDQELMRIGQATEDISERILGAPKGSMAINMDARLIGIKKYQ